MGAFDPEHKGFAPFAEFLEIFVVESFSGLNITSARGATATSNSSREGGA
jgi:hypothetical protein